MSPRDPLPLVSDAMARLYKANVGRGPSSVVTHFAGDDALVCLLEGTLSVTERRMIDQGEHDRVDEIRRVYEATSDDDFREVVREATGRPVRALATGHDLRADLVTQVFLLDRVRAAPAASGDAPRRPAAPPAPSGAGATG